MIKFLLFLIILFLVIIKFKLFLLQENFDSVFDNPKLTNMFLLLLNQIKDSRVKKQDILDIKTDEVKRIFKPVSKYSVEPSKYDPLKNDVDYKIISDSKESNLKDIKNRQLKYLFPSNNYSPVNEKALSNTFHSDNFFKDKQARIKYLRNKNSFANRSEFKTKLEKDISETKFLQDEIDDFPEITVNTLPNEEILDTGYVFDNTKVIFTKLDKTEEISSWISLVNDNFNIKSLPKIINGNLQFNNFLNDYNLENNLNQTKSKKQMNILKKKNEIFNTLIFNIEKINGSLIIKNNDFILNTYGFEKLKKINGNLEIMNNRILNNICNIKLKWKRITGKIIIEDNSSLKYISSNIYNNNTNNVYQVNGDNDLDTSKHFCKNFTKKVLYKPLTEYGKEFSYCNWDFFKRKYVFSSQINGNLIIQNSNMSSNDLKELLKDVEEINGDVVLRHNPPIQNNNTTTPPITCQPHKTEYLTNLDAFKDITINGNITIENCNKLCNICGLTKSLNRNIDEDYTFKFDVSSGCYDLITADNICSNTSIDGQNKMFKTIKSIGNGWKRDGTFFTNQDFLDYKSQIGSCQIFTTVEKNNGVDYEFTFKQQDSSSPLLPYVKMSNSPNKLINVNDIVNVIKLKDDFVGNIIIKGEWDNRALNLVKKFVCNIVKITGNLTINDFSFTSGTKQLNLFGNLKNVIGNILIKVGENVSSIHLNKLEKTKEINIILGPNSISIGSSSINDCNISIPQNSGIQLPNLLNVEKINMSDFANRVSLPVVTINIPKLEKASEINFNNFTNINLKSLKNFFPNESCDITYSPTNDNMAKQLCWLYEKPNIRINNSETNLSCQNCGRYFTGSNPFFNKECISQDTSDINSLKISGENVYINNNANGYTLTEFFCNVNNIDLYSFNNISSLELESIPTISITTSLNTQPIQTILTKIKDQYSNTNLQITLNNTEITLLTRVGFFNIDDSNVRFVLNYNNNSIEETLNTSITNNSAITRINIIRVNSNSTIVFTPKVNLIYNISLNTFYASGNINLDIITILDSNSNSNSNPDFKIKFNNNNNEIIANNIDSSSSTVSSIINNLNELVINTDNYNFQDDSIFTYTNLNYMTSTRTRPGQSQSRLNISADKLKVNNMLIKINNSGVESYKIKYSDNELIEINRINLNNFIINENLEIEGTNNNVIPNLNLKCNNLTIKNLNFTHLNFVLPLPSTSTTSSLTNNKINLTLDNCSLEPTDNDSICYSNTYYNLCFISTKVQNLNIENMDAYQNTILIPSSITITPGYKAPNDPSGNQPCYQNYYGSVACSNQSPCYQDSNYICNDDNKYQKLKIGTPCSRSTPCPTVNSNNNYLFCNVIGGSQSCQRHSNPLNTQNPSYNQQTTSGPNVQQSMSYCSTCNIKFSSEQNAVNLPGDEQIADISTGIRGYPDLINVPPKGRFIDRSGNIYCGISPPEDGRDCSKMIKCGENTLSCKPLTREQYQSLENLRYTTQSPGDSINSIPISSNLYRYVQEAVCNNSDNGCNDTEEEIITFTTGDFELLTVNAILNLDQLISSEINYSIASNAEISDTQNINFYSLEDISNSDNLENFFNRITDTTERSVLNINQLRIDKLNVNSIDLSKLNFKILSLNRTSTASNELSLTNIHYNPQNELILNLYKRPYNVSFAELNTLRTTTEVNTNNLTVRVEKNLTLDLQYLGNINRLSIEYIGTSENTDGVEINIINSSGGNITIQTLSINSFNKLKSLTIGNNITINNNNNNNINVHNAVLTDDFTFTRGQNSPIKINFTPTNSLHHTVKEYICSNTSPTTSQNIPLVSNTYNDVCNIGSLNLLYHFTRSGYELNMDGYLSSYPDELTISFNHIEP